MNRKIFSIILVFSLVISFSVTELLSQKKDKKQKPVKKEIVAPQVEKSNLKITFLELGSVSCIPCKKMQPIMQSIEKKYGDQIKVIFHDVWKDEAPAKKYGILSIPTQIFLDENDKEIYRHIGYYPEKEIDKFLQSKGLKIVQ